MKYIAIFLWKIVQTVIWGFQCVFVIIYTILVVIWQCDITYLHIDKKSFWFFIDNCDSGFVLRYERKSTKPVYPELEYYQQYYKTPKNLWLGHKTLEFRGKTLTFKN